MHPALRVDSLPEKGPEMNKPYVKKSGSDFVIGNCFLERTVGVRKGRIETTSFRNKLTGCDLKVTSRELLLKINDTVTLSNRDFTVTGTSVENAARGGRRLIISLCNEKHALDVELRFEVRSAEFYMRKEIKISKSANLINEIHVESLSTRGRKDFQYGGFGQPIFVMGQFFMGLEYPAGYNIVEKASSISLRHYPGRTGAVRSKKAVLGVCPDTVNNRIRDWFLEYIDAHRARPIKKFFSEYMNMSGPARLTDIKTWCFDDAQKMFQDQGLGIDCIVVSSSNSWVDPKSVMGELPEKKQAIPMSTLKRQARTKLGAGVAVHVNTAGGRGSSDHAWFAEHFDMISERYYCLADPRARRELTKNLLHLLRKYGVKMFSFDWIWWKTGWECPHGHHRGHIKGVKYGREAITDSMIEILQALRRENPDIVLQDLEIELSPWWLFYGEALWSYAGEGNNIPHAHIDGSMKGWSKRTVFPLSDIWYAVNVPFGAGLPRKKGEFDFKEFVDAVVMGYMRGSQIEEMYWYVKNLTAREKKAFTEVVKWARSRQDILLANTTFILGEPRRTEPYGFTHFRKDNRGVIGIHNPAHWEDRNVELLLNESAHFYQTGEPCIVKIVHPYEAVLDGTYGYGDSIALSVQGGEVLVLETLPVSRAEGIESGPELCLAANDAVVSNLKTAVPEAAKTSKLKVSFTLAVPDGEIVRLKVIGELQFHKDSLSEMEGLTLEEELEALNKRRLLSSARVRKEHLRTLTAESFVQKTQPAIAFSLKNKSRRIAVQREVKDNWRITYIGPHPLRRNRPLSRTWGTSPELQSGKVEFTVSSAMPGAIISLWLERERAKGSSRIKRAESLPCDVLRSRRTTLCLCSSVKLA